MKRLEIQNKSEIIFLKWIQPVNATIDADLCNYSGLTQWDVECKFIYLPKTTKNSEIIAATYPNAGLQIYTHVDNSMNDILKNQLSYAYVPTNTPITFTATTTATKRTLTYTSTSVQNFSRSITDGAKLYLFSFNGSLFSNEKFYYLKFWQNGVLKRDFVPAKINNVVGLYDNISNSFFTNIQSGGYFNYEL